VSQGVARQIDTEPSRISIGNRVLILPIIHRFVSVSEPHAPVVRVYQLGQHDRINLIADTRQVTRLIVTPYPLGKRRNLGEKCRPIVAT
jgi:hypothetical protein